MALLYGADTDTARRLAEALSPAALKLVPPEEYTMPVSAILSGQKPLAVQQKAALKEPMLILHGFSSPELDAALESLRKNGITVKLKAVTTPTNMAWDAYTFYENLSQEHRALKKGRRAH